MNPASLCLVTLLIIAALAQNHASPVSSFATKGFEIEEKTRLGSTPPSCHNKCNECHPCFAVQVPTLPRHDRLVTNFFDLPGNRYSNYKPLGWKCRCDNHFYNP
uniref:Epidermal patterning factor-like protein n=1 Tax=Kalanchoe fedtschenkoi TaxID=63787 RepID=A0A7N0URV1_KALFE